MYYIYCLVFCFNHVHFKTNANYYKKNIPQNIAGGRPGQYYVHKYYVTRPPTQAF